MGGFASPGAWHGVCKAPLVRPGVADQAGAVLLEALVALALLGFVAVGAASLGHGAARLTREAGRLDEALMIAETLLARTSGVSFARLPEFFAASPDAVDATLDTGDDSAPADWIELAQGLPEARITAILQGVAAGGGAARLDAGVALRVRVRVAWTETGRRREVELTDVRF